MSMHDALSCKFGSSFDEDVEMALCSFLHKMLVLLHFVNARRQEL